MNSMCQLGKAYYSSTLIIILGISEFLHIDINLRKCRHVFNKEFLIKNS